MMGREIFIERGKYLIIKNIFVLKYVKLGRMVIWIFLVFRDLLFFMFYKWVCEEKYKFNDVDKKML